MRHNFTRSFPVGIAEELQSYVYLYVDPLDDKIFYIGKGINNRVFDHLNEAEDESRDSAKVRKIRDVWKSGNDVMLRLHRFGMTDEAASHVEASLIQLYPDSENDVEGKSTLTLGDRLVEDVISQKSRKPAQIDFPAVLINIRKEWLRIRPTLSKLVDQNQLYQSTRTAWEGQPKRHRSVTYAILVAFGIVRQVYTIKSWRRASVHSDGTPRAIDSRWMFEGEVAADKTGLIGCSVDHLQKPGAQNAIRWLDNPGNIISEAAVEVYED